MALLSAIFHLSSRRIGVLVPDVVISEKHQDALEITEHPVEIGAAISDHAYKKPSEVTMELGFSSGGSLLDFADTSNIGITAGLSPREIYRQLLDLQETRQPFEVITGKRTYQNMLIRAIEVTTDKNSEHVLMCTLTLRELNMTATQTINVGEKKEMAMGNTTAPVKNQGVKSPVPVSNSSVLGSVEQGVNYLLGYTNGAL